MAIGSENLNLMRFAPNYVKYVGSLVGSAIKRDGIVLELGSGDGFQTSFVIKPTKDFYCVESDPVGRKTLALNGYQVAESLEKFHGMNVSSVFSINCLEHIENDSDAIRQVTTCLRKNGTLVLYVPAMKVLFSSMDTRVGHVRRYSRKSLRRICEENGLYVERIFFVDSLGALVTLVFKLIGNTSGTPSGKSLIFFDKYLFPISCVFDRFFNRLFGKNLFLVARHNHD